MIQDDRYGLLEKTVLTPIFAGRHAGSGLKETAEIAAVFDPNGRAYFVDGKRCGFQQILCIFNLLGDDIFSGCAIQIFSEQADQVGLADAGIGRHEVQRKIFVIKIIDIFDQIAQAFRSSFQQMLIFSAGRQQERKEAADFGGDQKLPVGRDILV